jgi:hypothetical protein
MIDPRSLGTWIFGVLMAVIVLVLTENFKELIKQRGGNTLLVRWLDRLPKSWQNWLSWQRLHGLWWLWLVFGVSGGFAISLWLTPFLSLGSSIHSEEPSTGIRDHHHGSTTFKGLAGMQWGLTGPAPIYLYSSADDIYVTDFFIRGMNVTNNEIKIDDIFILSGMTSKRLPMLINVDNYWIAIDKINPIPPHAEFDLRATLDNSSRGIPMTKFLKEWGTFSFVARYSGTEFKADFDQQAVTDRFSQMHPSPHVTRRQNIP